MKGNDQRMAWAKRAAYVFASLIPRMKYGVSGSGLEASLRRRSLTAGFTLVEILVVIGILAVLATLVVQSVGNVREEADQTVGLVSLQTVREAICGSAGAPGFLADMKFVPGFSNRLVRIGDLLEAPTNYSAFTNFDRLTRRGWRGPYVQNVRIVEGTNGISVADPWGNPVVLQMPTNDLDDDECWRCARLVSAGPDGILQTPAATFPDRTARGDDLVLFLNRADADE